MPLSPDLKVVQVKEWSDAIASCSDVGWENVGIEARNELTEFLNVTCKPEFQRWNDIVHRAKKELATTFQDLRTLIAGNSLPVIVADCVEWDVTNAIACEYYAKWHPPQFYLELLSIYIAGHFPCGWDGVWPQGLLRVF